jgi:hypothetical protein
MEQRKHICGTDEIRVHVKDGSELKYWAQKPSRKLASRLPQSSGGSS